MKKLLTIAVASIAVAAAADASYSPSIGVTSISLSQKNNVIPVQFTSLKESGAAVKVADLVCTNNIPLSSHLYVYDGGYTAWVLQATGWVPTATVSSTEGIDAGAGADAKSLPAGSAIWLSFPVAPVSAINVSFYGKVATSTNTTIAAGSKTEETKNPVSTLVCNPTGGDISGEALAGKLVSLNPAVGDKIRFDNSTDGKYYLFNGTSWGTFDDNYELFTPGLPTLSANKGFWYVSLGGTGTISW